MYRRSSHHPSLVELLLSVGTLFAMLFVPNASATDLRYLPQCATIPPFARKLGFTAPQFTSAEKTKIGLLMVDGREPSKAFQDDSWKKVGGVGPIAVSRTGEIFFAPAPIVNTLESSPRDRVTIFRVDPDTGVAAPLLTLAPQRLPNSTNPFGIVGLSFDCERDVLLVTSVSGSTQSEEQGSISIVDTHRAVVIDSIEKVDALGVSAIHFTDRDSWIVFGSARTPDLYRLRWDKRNRIIGRPVSVFSLPDGGYLRARKLAPTPIGIEVSLTEFRYALLGQSELRQAVLSLRYVDTTDTLTLAWRGDREFNPNMSLLAAE